MDAKLTFTVNVLAFDVVDILAQHLKEIENAFDDMARMDDTCSGWSGERLKSVIQDKSYLEKIERLL